MTRKGFLSLAILPFFGIKKKTPPPVAIQLAKAGIAALEAMQIHCTGKITAKGSDLWIKLKNLEK
jgi:hypothetical protein